MTRLSRKQELFDRAATLEDKPWLTRTDAERHIVNQATMLRESIAAYPGLEWTFDLLSGTQLYVTKLADPTQTWGPKVGDVITLNQCTGFRDSLGCHTADALGTIVHRSCVRLATPADPGYVMSHEEWMAYAKTAPDYIPVWVWSVVSGLLGALLCAMVVSV